MGDAELQKALGAALRKVPDLERLLARIHAFSTLSAANSATHYENIGKARLNEFIKALEGFEGLAAAVDKVAPQVAAVADAAPGLASMLTSGEGFPDLSELLEHFRNAFDWAKAQKEGRVDGTRLGHSGSGRRAAHASSSSPRSSSRHSRWCPSPAPTTRTTPASRR